MTVSEFLRRKNEIVFDVTGEVLIPEDQIIDIEPLPELKIWDTHINLDSDSCPYCKYYKKCEDCVMYKAGNGCLQEHYESKEEFEKKSTWHTVNEAWLKRVTKTDMMKLKKLIEQYEKERIENDNNR